MANYRQLVNTFQKLEIPAERPVIVHASLASLGKVAGGVNTLLGALVRTYRSILIPTFTYQTMVVPREGPENNGLDYKNPPESSQNAVFFEPDLPTSSAMGELAEALRTHPRAKRSFHPILSFAGIHVGYALESQTLSQPLAPIEVLADKDGWVLLLGVDQTANVSIHYAEQLAGRKQFIRWALTPAGVKECPNFPGCSWGFNALSPHIQYHVRKEVFGSTVITAMSLQAMIPLAQKLILEDPAALLCDKGDCARCGAVRSGA